MNFLAVAVGFAIAGGVGVLLILHRFAERRDFIGDHLDAVFADFHFAFDVDWVVGAEQLGAFFVGLRPRQHLDKTAPVLEIKTAVAIALLCVAQAQRRDDTAQSHLGRLGPLFQRRNGTIGNALERALVFVQGMAAD